MTVTVGYTGTALQWLSRYENTDDCLLLVVHFASYFNWPGRTRQPLVFERGNSFYKNKNKNKNKTNKKIEATLFSFSNFKCIFLLETNLFTRKIISSQAGTIYMYPYYSIKHLTKELCNGRAIVHFKRMEEKINVSLLQALHNVVFIDWGAIHRCRPGESFACMWPAKKERNPCN